MPNPLSVCLRWLCAALACSLAGTAMAQTPPLPKVLSVTELGTVQQNAVITGRDGTFSAPYGGASYWSFGDTAMRRANASGANFIANTLSRATSLQAAPGIVLDQDYLDSSKTPAAFIPLTDAEQAYNTAHATLPGGGCAQTPCGSSIAVWGEQVVPDPARHRLLFFFNEISRIPGNANFTVLGAGVAIGTPGADGLAVTRPDAGAAGAANTALLWNAPDFPYANGGLVVGNMVYAYGQNPQGLVMNVPLARAPLAQADQHAAWQYYAGNGGWSSDPAAAVTVLQGGAAGNAVFWNAYLGAYMAVYSAPFSNKVYCRVASQPWGPWSAALLLFSGQPGQSGTVDYAALAHPEFATGNGQTQYITYVRTTGFLKMEIRQVQVVFQ